jgi:hypothetical protein
VCEKEANQAMWLAVHLVHLQPSIPHDDGEVRDRQRKADDVPQDILLP